MTAESPAQGRVEAIYISPARKIPMRSVESVLAEAGAGLVGDRYHGTRHRHVSVQSREDLAEAAAVFEAPIGEDLTRRNITVSGIEVPTRPGERMTIADVNLEVVRIAAPCKLLDDDIGVGAKTALRRRAGTIFRVLSSGRIAIGDLARVSKTPAMLAAIGLMTLAGCGADAEITSSSEAVEPAAPTDVQEPTAEPTVAPEPTPEPQPAEIAEPTSAVASSDAPAGLDPEVADLLAQQSGAEVRQYFTQDFGRLRDERGISVKVPRDQAGPLVERLRASLGPGLLAWQGTDRDLGDSDEPGVEVVVAPGTSMSDAIQLANVDPVNWGLTSSDVAAWVEVREQQWGLELLAANTETLRLKITGSVDATEVAQQVADFCPDVVYQRFGEVSAFAVWIEENQLIDCWWD